MKKILLLGSSGWVAHYLIPSLQKHFPDCKLQGSVVSNTPEHSIETFKATSNDLEIIDKNLKGFSPDIVVNMTRGEDDESFKLHQYLIDICNTKGIHYNYFSSFNALDANTLVEHYEDELPNAQTDYGIFKGKCETELTKNSNNHSIFRFGATHGWAPNRLSRTETFLAHMLSGESLTIDTGVIQNRLATNHMTNMMAAVLEKSGEGVYHFGAIDGSEEIDFLRDLAESFGHPREQVVEGTSNVCNALMIPERTLQLIGKDYEKSEAETVHAVRHMIRLSHYIL